MNNSRMLPLGFLVLALAGAGAIVATAQTAPADTAAAADTVPVVQADFRGDRDGRVGGRGHGHRGGSDMMRALFAAVDADADGSVTQDEVDSYRAARLADADASGDGALSIEEFGTLYRAFTRPRMVDMFQRLDADGDGLIGTEEMDARFGDVVARMDRDGDGALSPLDRGSRNRD